MSEREATIELARRFLEFGRFEQLLAELISCPTESQKPETSGILHDYLDKAILPLLAPLGFDCSIHENPVQIQCPIMVAKRIESGNLPTVLCYGHGDVVRGQDDQWHPDLLPFVLKRRGDRLYGRGAADNKCQHLVNILALKAILKSRRYLGFNMIFLFEMGEELGSPGLFEFCSANQELLQADVLIASDGPRLRKDVPTVFLGSRGAINFELVVKLRDGAHHSGNWGGLLADPAIILAHAIASITDSRGQIAIDGWRPDSLTPGIKALIGLLPEPGGMDCPDIDTEWGEHDLSPAERAYGWNSFSVLALHSGCPEAPVNAIAGTARAQCQIRFVVGTEEAEIMPALRRHLDEHGFDAVKIEVEKRDAFKATRSDPDDPWVQLVQQSIVETVGQPADLLPNLAGSLPNHVFTDLLKIPTVWVPHSYAGCNQHAPDEHALVSICDQGLAIMAGIFWDIGKAAPR